MSGKGSNPRPFNVPHEDYEASFDRIFGKRERKEYVPPPLPDEADLADLAEAFARVDRESEHYLCNGKGWLEGPNQEELGPCPDCPKELRDRNMPQSVRDILKRGEQLMAMRPEDVAPDWDYWDIFNSNDYDTFDWEPPCPAD